MELHNTFTVPLPPRQAFDVLRDLSRIGPCMPGATIDEVTGDHFTGRVKVKIGPIQVTYRGEADYDDIDEDGLSATINARGRESRGAGTATAIVRATVTDGPDGGATVDVSTDLAITGKPAQFGRGVMADVGEKLIGQFAACLADELGRQGAPVADDTAARTPPEAHRDGAAAAPPERGTSLPPERGTSLPPERDTSLPPERDTSLPPERDTSLPPERASSSTSPTEPRPEAVPIDLLEVAGAPISKRLAPLAGVVVILLLLLRRRRRR